MFFFQRNLSPLVLSHAFPFSVLSTSMKTVVRFNREKDSALLTGLARGGPIHKMPLIFSPGLFLAIHGGGVPPYSSNPDPRLYFRPIPVREM